MGKRLVGGGLFALLVVSASLAEPPLGTGFSYQGRLEDAGDPANGLHDLRFRLFDAMAGGAPVGAAVCRNNVSVTDGLFSVALDFGAQFAGEERFLEIDVRADTGLDCANAAGFTVLGPRQALTAAPNALFAVNAATATTAAQLNGQSASFYQNASNVNAGTLADAQLSTNVALRNAVNTFSLNQTFSGNVGIGGAPNANDLHVVGSADVGGNLDAGTITIDPATRFYVMSRFDFIPGATSTTATDEPYIGSGLQTAIYAAPVHLPHSATVTALHLNAEDSASGDISAFLIRRGIDGSAGATMAQVSSSGNVAGVRVFSDTTIVGPVVNNDFFLYLVRLDMEGAVSTLRMRSIRIEYTVTQPLP